MALRNSYISQKEHSYYEKSGSAQRFDRIVLS